MKITDVQVYELEAALSEEDSFGSSQGWRNSRQATVVKVLTDEGLVGWGEGGSKSQIERGVKPKIVGRGPFGALAALRGGSAQEQASYMAPSSICGLDIALWDLMGKEVDLPIYKLLGGPFRKRVRVYATGLFFKKAENLPEVLAEEARGYVERGFTAVKMKVGYRPDRDVKCVSSVREAIGDDVQLMVDANQAYTSHTAKALGARLEECDVYWFEEPVPSHDLEGYIEVKNALGMAVAGGETLRRLSEFGRLLSMRAVDIVQPDMDAGGLSGCRRIAALAEAFNTTLVPHSWGTQIKLAACLHLTASLPPQPPAADPPPPLLEYDRTPNPLREEILIRPLEQKDGFMEVSEGPGLGVEVDERTIQRYSVE